MNPTRFVIIGDGAAGMTAARHLRDRSPLAEIMIVCDDPHPAYFRAALTNYLLGELGDSQVWATSPTFFVDYRLDRRLGRVNAVDTRNRRVHLADGADIAYDALLVASGAHARRAPFEGSQLAGVMTFRTLYDARAMLDSIDGGLVQQSVVIGGGPLAIEWAMALQEHGVATTMLVRGQRVMDSEIDPVGSDLVVARMRRAGIDVRLGEEVQSAFPGEDGSVAGVMTKRGETLPCQLLGVAIGAVPNTYFLQHSGIALSKRGSIVVDDGMRTNVDRVFAAGDVVEHQGQVIQLWEPAKRQAVVAAANMAGGNDQLRRGAHYFATRLADSDFASVGQVKDDDASKSLVKRSSEAGVVSYRKLLVRDGRLVGATMLGQRSERVRRSGRAYKRLIDREVDVTSIEGALLDPQFDLESWLRGRELVMAPPPTPQASSDAPSPAQMRGTQAVPVRVDAAPQRAPVAKKRAANLSIGLPAAGDLAHARASSTQARLEGAGQTWPITTDVILIGRKPSCDVVLDTPQVSLVHAQIVVSGDNHFLRDLGSSNGTWVKRELVTVPRHLSSGDSIHIASVELRYVKDGGEAAPHVAARGAATQPTLEVRRGPSLGLRFVLEEESISIGRDPACELCIDDNRVSRRHAVISRVGNTWYICDLSSRHGTFKNGTQLRPGEEVALKQDDELGVGDSVLVLVHD